MNIDNDELEKSNYKFPRLKPTTFDGFISYLRGQL